MMGIVWQDWIGCQEDTLIKADAVVNVVEGYTKQRETAAYRIVRESLSVNPTVLQITISPKDDELRMITPDAESAKIARSK